MALQMGVSLALAFAVGRWLFGVHWTWVVMTAFIVCSGNRGRGDVVYKSGLRIAGATAGTVAATLLAGAFAPGDTTTVVVIFVVLWLASWLRSLSYAYWAAGITSVLALLYGYFGASGTSVLAQRLEGILVGALIAVVVSWALVPVRTTDVLRRRLADVLAALGEVLAALTGGRAELALHERRFEHALDALEEIAKPLEAHRLLTRHRGERAHVADAIDAARRFEAPVRSIVACAADDPAALTTPTVIDRHSSVTSKLTAARRALAGRSGGADAPKAHPVSNAQDGPSSPLDSALAELDAALTSIAASYPGGDHSSWLPAIGAGSRSERGSSAARRARRTERRLGRAHRRAPRTPSDQRRRLRSANANRLARRGRLAGRGDRRADDCQRRKRRCGRGSGVSAGDSHRPRAIRIGTPLLEWRTALRLPGHANDAPRRAGRARALR
jgi:uncharacterized membrane protein YccC